MKTARRLAAVLLASASFVALAADQMPGRPFFAAQERPAALRVPEAATAFRFGAFTPKSAPAHEKRLAVGEFREAPALFADLGWQRVAGGFVSRFDVAAEGAAGIRVRLDLAFAGPLELRVRGGEGAVETVAIAAGADLAWGPWTAGEVQSVEVFSPLLPLDGAVTLAGLVHFDRPLEAKAAGACTVDVACTTNEAALDAAIAERKKSMARLSFVEDGVAFVCTGTLLNTEKFPSPYFLTANHCIGRADVAASITTFWFYENTACGVTGTNPAAQQVSGGMEIVYSDPNTDQTLLLMNGSPPPGVTYSGWDAAKLTDGQTALSLSHPAGDVAKWAQARVSGTVRFADWEQSAWLTTFTRGIIQGGSSGSGLFTIGTDGSLQLRSVLSATTVGANGGLSCTNTGEYGVYNRFDVFYPEIRRYLQANPAPVADDHGNRPQEATFLSVGAAETAVAGNIDYAGDVDVFRIPVAANGTLVVRAEGGMDTVGVLLDSRGVRLASNDDAQTSANDFGLAWRVSPGTYYLAVSRWESAGTGPYAIRASLSPVTDNWTDLWWNPAESGWGINVNHQGQAVFATLYTFEAGGTPLWLVMSNGVQQADGSFLGTLFRVSGPPFNTVPWTAVTETAVGTMRLAFVSASVATLSYTVNGTAVTKEIQRYSFSKATSCRFSAFDRTYARNYQDLWWNPNEPGWGLNLAHQGDIVFGTLFTYGADRRGAWYVMSNGTLQAPSGNSDTYSGTLFLASGPAFNASPWTPATVSPVGTMTVSFTSGNAGSLNYSVNGVSVTKAIQRYVFGALRPECEAND